MEVDENIAEQVRTSLYTPALLRCWQQLCTLLSMLQQYIMVIVVLAYIAELPAIEVK